MHHHLGKKIWDRRLPSARVLELLQAFQRRAEEVILKIKHTKSVEELSVAAVPVCFCCSTQEVYSFSELFILFQNYLPHQHNNSRNEHSICRLKGPKASPQTQQTSSCISCHLVCDCFLLTDGKTIYRTWFFGNKPVHGIGRMRLHLPPFKPKPLQTLSLTALKYSDSYSPLTLPRNAARHTETVSFKGTNRPFLKQSGCSQGALSGSLRDDVVVSSPQKGQSYLMSTPFFMHLNMELDQET